MPIYTAKDGSRHNTSTQAEAEKLAKKLQAEKGANPGDPNISLSSTFTDAQGNTDPQGTKVETFKGDKKISSGYIPYVPEPTLTPDQAPGVLKEYGLTGIAKDSDFAGLTRSQAQQKAAQLKQQKTGQVSTATSYGFNPATISGAKKTFESFNAKLQDTNSDPWTSKGTKKEKLAGLYESTANDFAKLFSNRDEFESLLAHDMDFAAGIEAFKRAGGDVNSIRSRIGGTSDPAPDGGASQRAAIEGLMAQGISDPQEIANAMNEAGRASGVDAGFTADEVSSILRGENNQTTAEYLSGLSSTPPAGSTPAETQAFESLIPERQLAQEQIARLASIPKQYQDMYFGTPEAMGILEEKRIQAEEQKKILERQEKADTRNARLAANIAIDKNNADLAIEEAQVEENRLAAKNYATGALAKMGALNTTGAAPLKLATLEQKYQQQAQQLRTQTRYANQSIELKLKEKVSDIEIQTDQDILDVQADLTKDREEVLKEVQKLEQASWDKIYTITDKAAQELRLTREKYTKAAKTLAEKNAKEYAKTASSYNVSKLGGKISGGTEAERKLQRLAEYQQAFTPGQPLILENGETVYTVDENGFITPEAWREALKEAPAMGLSKKDFIENFGSMLFMDKDGVPDKSYGLTAKEVGYLE